MIAEVPELAGVAVYGQTRDEAIKMVEALALRVIADRLDHGEVVPVGRASCPTPPEDAPCHPVI